MRRLLKFSAITTVLRAKPRISVVLMGLRAMHGYSLLTCDIIEQIFTTIYTQKNITEHLLCASISLSTRDVVVKKEN